VKKKFAHNEEYMLRNIFIAFLYIMILGFGLPSHAKIPSDIKNLSKIMELSRPSLIKKNKTKLIEVIQKTISKNVGRIISRDQLNVSLNNEKLSLSIKSTTKSIYAQLQAKDNMPKTLSRLGIQTGVDILSKWIGVPKEAHYKVNLKKKSLKELNVVQDRKLQDLDLLLNQSFITSDLGSLTSRNFTIDPGEWVTVSLKVQNDAYQRLFSSSVWFKSDHECLWMPKTKEHVLAELDANKKLDSSKTTLNLYFYVSKYCPKNTPLTIKVIYSDTHRNYGKRDQGTIVFELEKKMPILLVNKLIDRDEPGHSDGDEFIGIEYGANIEFSTSIQAHKNALNAQVAYLFSDDFNRLGKIKPALSKMTMDKATKGLFLPTDDVDITALKTKGPFNQAVKRALEGLSLDYDNESEILLAVDAFVEYQTNTDHQKVNQSKLKVRSKQNSDQRKSRPVPRSSSSNLSPSSSELIKLIYEHITLAPLPTAPIANKQKRESPLAILATNGYQVLFDELSFKLAYTKLKIGVENTTRVKRKVNQHKSHKSQKNQVTMGSKRWEQQRFFVPIKLRSTLKKEAKPKPIPKVIPKAKKKAPVKQITLKSKPAQKKWFIAGAVGHSTITHSIDTLFYSLELGTTINNIFRISGGLTSYFDFGTLLDIRVGFTSKYIDLFMQPSFVEGDLFVGPGLQLKLPMTSKVSFQGKYTFIKNLSRDNRELKNIDFGLIFWL
jgi:hypothetical protein